MNAGAPTSRGLDYREIGVVLDQLRQAAASLEEAGCLADPTCRMFGSKMAFYLDQAARRARWLHRRLENQRDAARSV